MRKVTEQPTPEEQPSYTLKTKDPLSVMHIAFKSNSGLQTHANATVACREAQRILHTNEHPEQLHILSLTTGTTFGSCCHRKGNHHTSIYAEGTQPFAWYAHPLRNCGGVSWWESSWKKQETHHQLCCSGTWLFAELKYFWPYIQNPIRSFLKLSFNSEVTYFYILTDPLFLGRIMLLWGIKYWLSAASSTSADNYPASPA